MQNRCGLFTVKVRAAKTPLRFCHFFNSVVFFDCLTFIASTIQFLFSSRLLFQTRSLIKSPLQYTNNVFISL